MAAPILTFRYYGPIEGRLVNIDRSASDAVRLTLDRVLLSRMSPERTPAKVRVSLPASELFATFNPGDTLILTGHLSPPSGPAEPGSFDFQRHAWFLELGAVGYTRTPVLRYASPETRSFSTLVFALRMTLSQAVQAAMPGEAGAFAAAIMTGDRSGMGQATLTDLRASNAGASSGDFGTAYGAFDRVCVCGHPLRACTGACNRIALADQKDRGPLRDDRRRILSAAVRRQCLYRAGVHHARRDVGCRFTGQTRLDAACSRHRRNLRSGLAARGHDWPRFPDVLCGNNDIGRGLRRAAPL